MAKWGKRRTRASPPATSIPSTTTISTNPASSSPYFLPDLIPLVASRLTTLEDFFALRAACRAYRARLPLSSSNLASQGPLLLVRHKASTSEALFHVPRRRILRFRLPCARRRGPIPTCLRCLFPARVALADPSPTSFHSFGCRVAIQDAGRPELRIRHLLTGKRAGARLPGPPEECDAVIFSGDLVIAFRQWRPDLYYCRTGDAHWRTAWCDVGYQLYSLMSVEGTLYALTYPNYGLATVELDNNSVVLSFLEDKLSAETVLNCSTLWLAECHGELLLIVRTSTYHVFRWESGERKWARTESLGGCSLFFNIHEFAGSLGPDHPAVRRDCLYFTGWSGNWSEYSFVDGSLHENVVDYPGQAARKNYVPLAWVLPSIC